MEKILDPGERLRDWPVAGTHGYEYLNHVSAQNVDPARDGIADASHFAPDHLMAALHLYRSEFQPSDVLDRPYAMVGAQLSMVTNVADISRFARSRADVRIGLVGGSTTKLFMRAS